MKARLILTPGLHRSGSTWMFNAARLLALAAARRVSSDFYDGFGEEALACPDDCDVRLLKAHLLSPRAISLIAQRGRRVILTVRDPRDCVASLMMTFDVPFDEATNIVTTTCNSLLVAIQALGPRIYRYEDGFVERQDTLAEVSRYLRLPVGYAAISEIAANLRRSSIEAKIAGLADEGIIDSAKRSSFDPVTHWHPGHLGDGRVGKYSDVLTPEQIALVGRKNSRFIGAFGYG